jgi:glycine/serine hydroxymethyltransferase
MGASEMKRLGNWLADVVDDVENESVIARVAAEIRELCDHFPAPGISIR